MGLPWISVKTNLPTHRKSFELGVRLQDTRAWCYLVQLWCWAAENEPTGKLSGDRRASVAEHFAGWTGEPGKFVAEAIAVGFMDDDGDTLELHDWDEHQGAHIAKAERDADRIRKKRAELRKEQRRASVARQSHDDSAIVARASRVRGEERRGEEEDQKLLSSAVADPPAPPEQPEVAEPPQASPEPTPQAQKKSTHPEALQALWNERAAPALPRAIELTPKRRRSAAARLQERPINGPSGWVEVVTRISASAFCRGEKPGHDWRASFDWLLQPDTAAKVLEGKYDNPPEKAQAPPVRAAPVVQLKAGGRDAVAAKGWCSPGLDDWLTENAEVAK